jgi:predicted regulator of Ras-like GTPase activity (Roadblock/LC7/MglB family)
MEQASPPMSMNWVLDDLVRRVAGVRQAVILSRDGLALGASSGLSRDEADHLSAVAAGVQSLARGAGDRFRAGNVRQTIIEMDSALLFIAAAGQGSCLAVLSVANAEPGLIAYEMAMLAKRIGQHLAAHPRSAVLPDFTTGSDLVSSGGPFAWTDVGKGTSA